MIVDTHILKASKSFLGFSKRKPPVMIDLPFDRVMEIDSCTDFKIAQLLYQEQHDKTHQKNSKEAATAVSANTHSTFEISVDVPGQGIRRFVAGNMHDEITTEKNALHFCLVHDGSRGVCEKELQQAVAMKRNKDSVEVSVSTAIPSDDVWIKLTPYSCGQNCGRVILEPVRMAPWILVSLAKGCRKQHILRRWRQFNIAKIMVLCSVVRFVKKRFSN